MYNIRSFEYSSCARLSNFSSWQCFSGVDPYALVKFEPHPFWIILPATNLGHHRHCVAEQCLGLDMLGIWTFTCLYIAPTPKGLSSTIRAQSSLSVYRPNCIALRLYSFSVLSPRGLIRLVFPSFPLSLDFGIL